MKDGVRNSKVSQEIKRSYRVAFRCNGIFSVRLFLRTLLKMLLNRLLVSNSVVSNVSARSVSSKYTRPQPRQYRRRLFEAAVKPILPEKIQTCGTWKDVVKERKAEKVSVGSQSKYVRSTVFSSCQSSMHWSKKFETGSKMRVFGQWLSARRYTRRNVHFTSSKIGTSCSPVHTSADFFQSAFKRRSLRWLQLENHGKTI